jgi:hypothetical protein
MSEAAQCLSPWKLIAGSSSPGSLRKRCTPAGRSGRYCVTSASPLTRCGAHPNRRLMAHRVRDRLTATRRDHLKHVTTRAYVRGYVCRECREHQRIRMARNRG